MGNMSDINFGGLYSMFKGEPGLRKSTQALSYPGPQYWFSWDRKMNGIYLPMKRWGIDPKTIEYDDYDDWNKARTKLEGFRVKCPYKTLVFDSLTSMADMTLRQTLQLKYGMKRASGATAGKLVGGIAVNEMEDYNAESAALQELISLTKDIQIYHNINVILIAHVVQAEYKNATGQTHVSRQIITAGKKIAPKIPAYCGEVYHFNIDQGMVVGQGGKYCILTEHTGDDFARSGLGLPTKIEFGEKPLYETWIKPAIDKLISEPSSAPTKF
jgi:hypothetical protein